MSLLGRILIVDDERDIALSLKRGLSTSGFEVATYDDPLTCLSEFKPGLYDVAILDIRMPKMNGFQLYRALSKIDLNLKFIFLTAFEIYQNEFQAMFPGVHAARLLKKPIAISDLRSILESTLVIATKEA